MNKERIWKWVDALKKAAVGEEIDIGLSLMGERKGELNKLGEKLKEFYGLPTRFIKYFEDNGILTFKRRLKELVAGHRDKEIRDTISAIRKLENDLVLQVREDIGYLCYLYGLEYQAQGHYFYIIGTEEWVNEEMKNLHPLLIECLDINVGPYQIDIGKVIGDIKPDIPYPEIWSAKLMDNDIELVRGRNENTYNLTYEMWEAIMYHHTEYKRIKLMLEDIH